MLERMIDELSFAKFQKDLKDSFSNFRFIIKFTTGLYSNNNFGGRTEELIFIQNEMVKVFDYDKKVEVNKLYIKQIWLNVKLLYKINNNGCVVAQRIQDYINENIEKVYINNNTEINENIYKLIKK